MVEAEVDKRQVVALSVGSSSLPDHLQILDLQIANYKAYLYIARCLKEKEKHKKKQ